RIVRYKKLWKSVKQRYEEENFRREPEIEISSPEGLRYAAVTEVTRENFLAGVSIVRRTRASALILTQRTNVKTEAGVRSLFDAAFLKEDGVYESMVSWSRLAARRCPEGEILIKASGSWDERQYSLDFLGLPENLRWLGGP